MEVKSLREQFCGPESPAGKQQSAMSRNEARKKVATIEEEHWAGAKKQSRNLAEKAYQTERDSRVQPVRGSDHVEKEPGNPDQQLIFLQVKKKMVLKSVLIK